MKAHYVAPWLSMEHDFSSPQSWRLGDKKSGFHDWPPFKERSDFESGVNRCSPAANTHPAGVLVHCAVRLQCTRPIGRCPQLWNRDHAPFLRSLQLASVTAWSKDHSSDARRAPSRRLERCTLFASDGLVMRLQAAFHGATMQALLFSSSSSSF